MNAIPDDIQRTAYKIIYEAQFGEGFEIEAPVLLQRALMAERERCAKIVEHRVELARTVAPEAAGALFVALPEAIRGEPHHG